MHENVLVGMWMKGFESSRDCPGGTNSRNKVLEAPWKVTGMKQKIPRDVYGLSVNQY